MNDAADAVVEATATGSKPRARRERGWLCCLTCGHRITRAGAATTFDGGHMHRFINPHGLHFHIALYAEAPGCVHEGEATDWFSWFPGYTWRIAHCGGCGVHLGWAFECIGTPGPGEPGGFHGLIRERVG